MSQPNTQERISPKQVSADESSGGPRNDRIIEVYVCPTGGCGNYYGASGMGHLEKEAVRAPSHAEKDPGKIRFYRNRCPDCGASRVRRYARIIQDDEVADARAQVISYLKR